MILNLRYFTEFSNRMPLTQAALQTAGPGSQAPAGLAGLVSLGPRRLLGAFSLRTLLQGAAGARHSSKTLGNSNSFITAPRGRSRSDSPFNRPGPRGAVRRRTWLALGWGLPESRHLAPGLDRSEPPATDAACPAAPAGHLCKALSQAAKGSTRH